MPPLPRHPISLQAEPGGGMCFVCVYIYSEVCDLAGTANPTITVNTGLDTAVQMS